MSITVDKQAATLQVRQADRADELRQFVDEATVNGLLSADYVLTAAICHIRDEDDAENDKVCASSLQTPSGTAACGSPSAVVCVSLHTPWALLCVILHKQAQTWSTRHSARQRSH